MPTSTYNYSNLHSICTGMTIPFTPESSFHFAGIRKISLPNQRTPQVYADISADARICCTQLIDLLSRIPELIHTFEETTGENAQCFELFPAANGLQMSPIAKATNIQRVGVLGNYSKEHLTNCELALDDLNEYMPKPRIKYYSNSRWAGSASHVGKNTNFFDYVEDNPNDQMFYQSPMSGYYFISPLLKHIKDPLAIHLMLSYQLSILARYRPAVWREIIEGHLDQYRILIATYNRIFARVVPHLALNTINGRRIHLAAP